MSYSYDLSFWEIEKRDRRKPYRLRWSVNGRRPPFSRSFLTKELAEAFRDEVLKAAAGRGERFEEATGLPESVLRKDLDVTWYKHAHEYVAARWKGSAGNSRRSIVESMTCVTPVLVRDLRGAPDPDTLRLALRKDFNKGQELTLSPDETRAIAWLERASLPVSSLNDDTVVTNVLDAMASRLDRKQAAPDYYARRLRVTRTCLTFAVRQEATAQEPVSGRQPAPCAVEGRFSTANDPQCAQRPWAGVQHSPYVVACDHRIRRARYQAGLIGFLGLRPAPRLPGGGRCSFQEVRPRRIDRHLGCGGDPLHELWRELAGLRSGPAALVVWTVSLAHGATHEWLPAYGTAGQQPHRHARDFFTRIRGPGCRACPPQQSRRLIPGELRRKI
jgi:hypothetical protein